MGPTSGSGAGTFDIGSVAQGNLPPLFYGGVIANNGAGTGGLTKLSFGGLTLYGQNTYSGPTMVENGTLTLDFAGSNAPANNIINPNSSLSLGGATSGAGTTNYSALVMNPAPSGVNSQTFNGTTVNFGAAFIRGNANGSGTANLNLGLLSHNSGGYVVIIPPAIQGGSGNITTTTTNINGIIGGWATVGDGIQPTTIRPFSGTNWACVDVNGNIVGFNNFALYTGGYLTNVMGATNNIIIDGSTSGDIQLDADDGVPRNYDVNTITSTRSSAYSLQVGTNHVLRLGQYGALFENFTGSGFASWAIGNSVAGGNSSASTAGYGTLTAGGADNTPGDLTIIIDTTGSTSGFGMRILTAITDNGTGPVTVVKGGCGYVEFGSSNSYSGGTYFLQGRIQPTAPANGIPQNNYAFGTGDLYVFPGCYLYLNPATASGEALPNRVFVAGDGTQQEKLGCIRFQNPGWAITNTVTLIGDATIGGNNGIPGIMGQITGPFNLTFGSAATVNGSLCISSTNNNWTGNTTMQNRSGASSSLICSNSYVIPHGFGKGNVIMSGVSGGTYMWDLHGFNETVNGLSTIGNAASCFISNHVASTISTLTIGDNDQSGLFGGVIGPNVPGDIALTKIGGGAETFTNAQTYVGVTTVSNGVLQLAGHRLHRQLVGRQHLWRHVRCLAALLHHPGPRKPSP